MNNPKVLVLDIETFPMTAYIWDLKDQYVNLNQIKTDWEIAAFGAKWLNTASNKVFYRDRRNDTSETTLLKELWNLLNEADIVLTQNGEKFDGPKINARLILNGFKPPKPYKHLDTYKLAKKVAAFTSHSLAYLTNKLCKKYKKLSHSKFPGLTLWKECLANNKLAWEEMKRYNIHDVLSTEELYLTIRAWAPESMPTPFDIELLSNKCAVCGLTGTMQKRGIRVTKKTKYHRMQCQDCGTWTTGEKIK